MMAMHHKGEFSGWLRQARLAADLTQEALAEAVGCAAQTLRAFESGRRRPSRAMAARIAAVLQIPPAERDGFVRLARTLPQAEPASPTLVQPVEPTAAAPALDARESPRAPHAPLVLATKLYQPRHQLDLVPRPRLIAHLAATLTRPLTLVAAPAGCGKTTLVSAWLEELRQGPGPPPHVAWLTLDADDADPVSFVRYLIAALQTIAPALGGTTLAQLERSHTPLVGAVLPGLVNELTALPDPSVLVLDDYHVIDALPVHQALAFLLEHLPPQLHLVITSRTDPPLPLARLRARRQLVEVRAAELHFTRDEAAAFLTDVMALPLAPDEVAALAARTEGWVAGLQLAALSLQDRPGDQLAPFIAAFAGSHRYVVDYLADEVLAAQPARVQRFLIETAILDRLCGPLCDFVTGIENREGRTEKDEHDAQRSSLSIPNAQFMLEHLERANLFLIPLDDQRGWYRYHQLFAQVLRERLAATAGSAAIAILHGRASVWFAERGLSAEAVQHALAARDWERAAGLIERHGRFLVVNGHGQTVQRWLADLPAAVVRAHPYLHLIRAVGLFFANELEALDEHLQGVEAQLTAAAADDPARRSLGYATILRASSALFRGDVARCVELAHQGLAILPADDSSGRIAASVHVAEAYVLTGDVGPGAERLLSQAVEAARRSGELTNQFYALVSLAAFRRRQGRLDEAASHYREAAQLLPDEQGIPALPNGANYFFGLGDLLAERHDPRAEDLLARGRQMVQEQRLAQGESIVLGYTALAELQQARGDHAAAEATLAELQAVAGRRKLTPRLLARAEAVAAHLALRRGDLAAAAAWAERSGITVNDAPDYPREREQLSFCRVRLAQGRQRPTGPALHEVLGMLARLLATAESCERIDSVIELLVLRALTFEAQGRRGDGLRSLERALQLAATAGYLRVFVAEGAAVATLLSGMKAEGGRIKPYIVRLLAAYSDEAMVAGPHLQPSSLVLHPSPEPLTQRELDVLRLLALGYSNQTIARELVLAVGTVKRHINNLFGKLQVESRLQAVARARDLDLL